MKPVNVFTALVSVDPLDPLFSALPPSWRVGIAVALFSLLGLYYLFLVIQAFPWLPGGGANLTQAQGIRVSE